MFHLHSGDQFGLLLFGPNEVRTFVQLGGPPPFGLPPIGLPPFGLTPIGLGLLPIGPPSFGLPPIGLTPRPTPNRTNIILTKWG